MKNITEKEFIENGLRPGYADEVGQEIMISKLKDIDREKYSHLLIVMDTFSYEDEIYSVEVPNGKLAELFYKHSFDLQSVLKVVKLEKDNHLICAYESKTKEKQTNHIF